jgi:hypothetical protein
MITLNKSISHGKVLSAAVDDPVFGTTKKNDSGMIKMASAPMGYMILISPVLIISRNEKKSHMVFSRSSS